jgi:serine/threonine-protein kinase
MNLNGRKLGKYRIVDELGKGAQATVYRAVDESLQREVAVKVLALDEDPDMRERFEQEARLIAKFDHPNIVPIYDFGEEGGLAYFVTMLVRGGALATRMRRGRMTELETAGIVKQVAQALDYAHARGVIHRDVKPANVLLADDGRPLLSDFGIAKVLSDAISRTQPGTAPGTPAYMSPDPITGAAPDGKSDQYSLAVVAYELLCGARPFRGDTAAELVYHHMHTQVDFDQPAFRGRHAVVAALARALAKQRSARFGNCTQFAEELERALRETQVAAPEFAPSDALTVELDTTRIRNRRTRKVWGGVALGAAVLALGLFVWAPWTSSEGDADVNSGAGATPRTPEKQPETRTEIDGAGDADRERPVAGGASTEGGRSTGAVAPNGNDEQAKLNSQTQGEAPPVDKPVAAPTPPPETEPERGAPAESPADSLDRPRESSQQLFVPTLTKELKSLWNLRFVQVDGVWVQECEVSVQLARELGLEVELGASAKLPLVNVNLALGEQLANKLNQLLPPDSKQRFVVPDEARLQRVFEAAAEDGLATSPRVEAGGDPTKPGYSPGTEGAAKAPDLVRVDVAPRNELTRLRGLVGNVRELARRPGADLVVYFGGAELDRLARSIDLETREEFTVSFADAGNGLRLILEMESP